MSTYPTIFENVPRKELQSSTLRLKQEHNVHYLFVTDCSSAQPLFQRTGKPYALSVCYGAGAAEEARPCTLSSARCHVPALKL